MSNIDRIHQGKTPIRLMFITEWADRRGLKQADIVREIGANKGLVSRWFKGTLPNDEYLEKLAALFGTDIHGLFRHPDDDWISKMFKERALQDQMSKASPEKQEEIIDVVRVLLGKAG